MLYTGQSKYNNYYNIYYLNILHIGIYNIEWLFFRFLPIILTRSEYDTNKRGIRILFEIEIGNCNSGPYYQTGS